MGEVELAADLEGVTPTGKLVYIALQEADRPLTTDEIADRTRTSPRSVRAALNSPDEVGMIGTNGDPVSPGYRLVERYPTESNESHRVG